MDAQRIPRLSLDLLRGFRAAARHLSFTRAAQELFVTQPAISREIRTLEQQLGRPLFRRVNRGLELTKAGEELYRAVDEALDRIDAAALRVAGALRTLSVTTTVAMASTWLVPRLPRFAQLHPEIDMRVVASNDWIDLERAQIDVAVRFLLVDDPARARDKLFDYHQFPVCSPAVANDLSRPLRSISDLSRHVLLDFETTVYGRSWHDWERWFDAKKIQRAKPARSLTFSHYDQVIDAAIKGSGIAVGKLPHLIDHLRDGILVAPLGTAGVARIGGFFIEFNGTAQHDVADAFATWLRAEAGPQADRVQENGQQPLDD
jgi:DNA-binding transcriptional LysR family regulator